MKRFCLVFLALLLCLFAIVACDEPASSSLPEVGNSSEPDAAVTTSGAADVTTADPALSRPAPLAVSLEFEKSALNVGENLRFWVKLRHTDGSVTAQDDYILVFLEGEACVRREGDCFLALAPGKVTLRVGCEGLVSDPVSFTVLSPGQEAPRAVSLLFSAEQTRLLPGESTRLHLTVEWSNGSLTDAPTDTVQILAGEDCVSLSADGRLTAQKAGHVELVALYDALVSNTLVLEIEEPAPTLTGLALFAEKDGAPVNALTVGDTVLLRVTAFWSDGSRTFATDAEIVVIAGASRVKRQGNTLTALSAGEVQLTASAGGVTSAPLVLTLRAATATDPYVNMSEDEFYRNYHPATSYEDAVYRTKHYFMSGSIEDQDQEPTLAPNRPKENGLFVRNTGAYYTDNGHTYCVVDASGMVVNRIYEGGAYVTLEEVAAYVLAFGDVPPNYSESTGTRPSSSPWGRYLRLNHNYFSGDTGRYPYEPVLPDIQGEGGRLAYYEIDIGTTGTDCDPNYTAALYNNGSRITRGAARIVYTRFDANGDKIIDVNEKYVFYTYNHYNDFQEYLNYEYGWGEMFGNITGGGSISSRTDYNPTPYVPTAYRDFLTSAKAAFLTVAAPPVKIWIDFFLPAVAVL